MKISRMIPDQTRVHATGTGQTVARTAAQSTRPRLSAGRTTRRRRAWAAPLMGLGLMVALLWAVDAQANALSAKGVLTSRTLFVDAESQGDGSGADWDNAFTDLQPALNEAISGDSIWVACATYLPTELADETEPRSASFIVRSGVTLLGGFVGGEENESDRDPNPETNGCSLGDLATLEGDFEGFFHLLRIQNVPDAVTIDGFSIVAGRATGAVPRGAGARVEDSNVTFQNARFDDVRTEGGGGGIGGAVFASDSQLRLFDVSVTRCFSGRGGAVAIVGGALLARRLMVSQCSTGFGGGGALFPRNGASADIEDSTFVNNFGNNQGGAIVTLASGPITIRRSIFRDNSSRFHGGAISHPSSSPLVIESSVFVGNRLIASDSNSGGGAIEATGSSQVTLTNTTIAFNEGGGNGLGVLARSNANVVVQNSIVFGNFSDAVLNKGGGPAQLEVQAGSNATLTASFSLVEFGFPGEGNLSEEPQFVQLPNPGDGTWATDEDNDFGNLRLLVTSPAIDAGDNTAPIDATGAITDTAADLPFDAELLPRLVDTGSVPDTGIGGPPVIDMGAFEFIDPFENGFKDGFETAPTP